MNEHDPENPRDWDPNSKELKHTHPPHETAAVLRCYHSGLDKQDLYRMFKRSYSATQLMQAMNAALEQENKAKQQGREIIKWRIK